MALQLCDGLNDGVMGSEAYLLDECMQFKAVEDVLGLTVGGLAKLLSELEEEIFVLDELLF